jgi:hypothetical protein
MRLSAVAPAAKTVTAAAPFSNGTTVSYLFTSPLPIASDLNTDHSMEGKGRIDTRRELKEFIIGYRYATSRTNNCYATSRSSYRHTSSYYSDDDDDGFRSKRRSGSSRPTRQRSNIINYR